MCFNLQTIDKSVYYFLYACDYVPVVSTVTNLSFLVLFCIADNEKFNCLKKTYTYQKIRFKPSSRFCSALVPFIGNFLLLASDIINFVNKYIFNNNKNHVLEMIKNENLAHTSLLINCPSWIQTDSEVVQAAYEHNANILAHQKRGDLLFIPSAAENIYYSDHPELIKTELRWEQPTASGFDHFLFYYEQILEMVKEKHGSYDDYAHEEYIEYQQTNLSKNPRKV